MVNKNPAEKQSLQRPLPPGLVPFWLAVCFMVSTGLAYLQCLGPPLGIANPASRLAAAMPVKAKSAAAAPGALAKAATINPDWLVPQTGPDDPAFINAFAASLANPATPGLLPPDAPRIAILVAGLGNNALLATQAASKLPPAISFAISPFGKQVRQAAMAAREAGHETILLLPMPGLIANAPESQNQAMLDWSFAQIQNYAGVTDAFGPAMGGGFMADANAKTWLLTNLARKNLFFIDGGPAGGAPPFAWGRNADAVIDPSLPGDETAKLQWLETAAETQHATLGIMLDSTPDAISALASWSKTLAAQNIVLVPVSSLVAPPAIKLPLLPQATPAAAALQKLSANIVPPQ